MSPAGPEHVVRVLAGEQAGSVYPIGAGLVLGRADGCDVCLADRRLSRRHAQIRVEDGRLLFEDLESQHGSFVNGVRTIRSVLSGGDILDVGDSRLRVETERTDEPTPVRLVQAPASLRAQIVKAVRPEDTPNLGTRNFAIVHAISLAIQRERDATQMLATVIDQVLEAVSADRGYVAVLADKERLLPKTVRYRDQSLAPHLSGGKERVAMSRTVAEQVLRERIGMISTDAARDERFATTDTVLLSDIHSLMAVPMLVGDRVVGLIEIEVFNPDTQLTESDLDLLSVVASTVAVALDNLELARMREETITQLRAAQQELLATQDRLVRSEQLAVVGRLASGVAHEVKNHLSPFMLADMIRHRYPDDEEIQESVEIMLEAQKHIYNLVDEVRIFARGSESDYDLQPCDLCEIVDNVIRFLRCDAKVKRTELVLIREGEPLLQLDTSRIRQVLINLIRNAADAMDGKGRIQIRIRENETHAIVDVMDTGKGIAADVGDKVFKPFFSTKGDKGLGLGLDISRKIVEAHGGTLTFKSKVGTGTTFRIKLNL